MSGNGVYVAAFKTLYNQAMYALHNTMDEKKRNLILHNLLSYGITHAGVKGRVGLFVDTYTREGTISNLYEFDIKTGQSLLFQCCKTMLDGAESNCVNQFYIPCFSKGVAEWFAKKHKDKNLCAETIAIDGKNISFIKLDKPEERSENEFQRDIVECIKKIGHLGFLASSDTLLHIIVNKCSDLGALINDRLRVNFDLKPITLDDTCGSSSWRRVQNIDELLTIVQALNIPPTFQYHNNAMLRLLREINKQTKGSNLEEYVKLTLGRIADLYADIETDDFGRNTVRVELICDEIILLKQLLNLDEDHYKLATEALLSLINHSIQLSDQSIMPSTLRITSSGLQSLTILLSNARSTLQRVSEYVSVMVQQNTYFECYAMLAKQISTKYNTIQKYIVGGHQNGDPKQFDNQTDLADIMLLSVNANVNTDVPGFISHDLHALISPQVAHATPKKPLIVIIDTTMTTFDDQDVHILLERYSEQIKEGRIGIYICKSLNKLFHCGLDKTPAGIMYGYFDKNNEILKKIVHTPLEDYTNSVGDRTLAYIEALSKFFGHQDEEYFSTIRGMARKVYDTLIPKSLIENSNSMVTIDNPFSTDIFKDPWPFVTIRINPTLSQVYVKAIHRCVYDMLVSSGVVTRDGFGYLETSIVLISDSVIRLSIGLNAEMCNLDLVMQLIDALNQGISTKTISYDNPKLTPYISTFVTDTKIKSNFVETVTTKRNKSSS